MRSITSYCRAPVWNNKHMNHTLKREHQMHSKSYNKSSNTNLEQVHFSTFCFALQTPQKYNIGIRRFHRHHSRFPICVIYLFLNLTSVCVIYTKQYRTFFNETNQNKIQIVKEKLIKTLVISSFHYIC